MTRRPLFLLLSLALACEGTFVENDRDGGSAGDAGAHPDAGTDGDAGTLDAAVDAGSRDAGDDAGTDAGADAGLSPDSGGGDAGIDAGVDAGRELPGVDCTIAGYAGWRCARMTFARPDAGTIDVDVRFNLPGAMPGATLVWVLGGNGTGRFRTDYNARDTQDLGAARGYRSVELEFSGPDGYWQAPALGYVGAGQLVTTILRELRALGVVDGDFVNYIGGSNGTTIGAAGLARAGLADLVSRVVFLSGPFLSSARAACTDASSAEYMDMLRVPQLVDTWNDLPGTCAGQIPDAVLDTRSVLGAGAQSSYPDLHVHVVLGDLDEYGPWVLRANELWLHNIVAGEETRHVIAGLDHNTFGGPGIPSTAPLRRSLALMQGFALATPETRFSAMPAVIFAATPGGAPRGSFTVDETVHGRIEGFPSDRALNCAETIGVSAGACALPAAFGTIDAATWTWNAGARIYETSFRVGDIVGPGEYANFVRDPITEAQPEGTRVVVTP